MVWASGVNHFPPHPSSLQAPPGLSPLSLPREAEDTHTFRHRHNHWRTLTLRSSLSLPRSPGGRAQLAAPGKPTFISVAIHDIPKQSFTWCFRRVWFALTDSANSIKQNTVLLPSLHCVCAALKADLCILGQWPQTVEMIQWIWNTHSSTWWPEKSCIRCSKQIQRGQTYSKHLRVGGVFSPGWVNVASASRSTGHWVCFRNEINIHCAEMSLNTKVKADFQAGCSKDYTSVVHSETNTIWFMMLCCCSMTIHINF